MLRVVSAGKVGAAAARAILERLGAVERTWWRDPFGFDVEETDRPQELKGQAELFRPSGVDPQDDLFMAFSDMGVIVGLLREWAARHRIKWRLTMGGDDWGAVDPTGCSEVLRGQMRKWARRAGVDAETWEVDEARRAAILGR